MSGWFYERGTERVGPITLAQLKQLVAKGEVARTTRVHAEGLPDWVEAGSLPLLYAEQPSAVERALLPVGRSGYAIAAGYLGLLAMVPLCAPLAIVFSILAIRDLRRHPEKHGWGRIITGLVLGVPFTVLWLFAIWK